MRLGSKERTECSPHVFLWGGDVGIDSDGFAPTQFISNSRPGGLCIEKARVVRSAVWSPSMPRGIKYYPAWLEVMPEGFIWAPPRLFVARIPKSDPATLILRSRVLQSRLKSAPLAAKI